MEYEGIRDYPGLKPCPFCGGKASAAEINTGGYLGYIAISDKSWSASNSYADEKECISSWDKRGYER